MTAKAKFLVKFSLLTFTVLLTLLFPTNAISRPVSAIIYPDDAKITEHLMADIQKEGVQPVARFFLPIFADKQTLAIQVALGSKMQISSVKIEKQPLPLEEPVKKLKKKLKSLRRKKSEFEARINANNAYISFWHTQANNPLKKIETIESVKKLGIAVKTGITDAYDAIYQHNQSLNDLSEQITDIQKKLNDLTGAAKKRWQVTVYLTGNPQPKIALTCSYHVRNCGWQSRYTINALPAESKTKLNWYAEIKQNTGMDWEGVELKIATVQEVIRPTPPNLRDWIIQPKKPFPYPGAKRKSTMADEALMAMAPEMRADMAAGAQPMEPAQDQGFMFDTYDLGKHSLESGESRRFTIREMILKSDFKYLIRPQVSPQAFLFATLDIEEDSLIKLPMGDASFLVASAFIANRPFSLHDRQQKLFFGADPQVTVKLATKSKKSNKTGFLIGKKEFEWGWEIAVSNHKPIPIAVLMEDAYPQIRDKRIKLKEVFNGTSPQKEKNILKWNFSVLPNKEIAVAYGFSVTYPDEMDLSFGGR